MTDANLRLRIAVDLRVCSVDGCEKKHLARGLCGTHYANARRNAQLPAKIDRISIFWAKVDKTQTCWNWTGGLTFYGYGRFNIDNTRWPVHRLAYELLVGPIPDGLVLDHLCRNRRCVNPEHLEPVTGRENTLRGVGPSAESARATHCPAGHEFTPENTKRLPKQRRCRQCANEATLRWKRKQGPNTERVDCPHCGRSLHHQSLRRHIAKGCPPGQGVKAQ